MKFKELQLNDKGFNIIEILIMISLVTLTFVAIMSLVMKNVQLEYLSKNDFAAISLTKEGLDLVEEIRNNNVAVPSPFFNNLIDSADEGRTCYFRIDYFSGLSNRSCFPGTPPTPPAISNSLFRLKFDSNSYYQYSLGADSSFYRLITVVYHTGTNSGPYMDVKSQVYWEYKSQGYSYVLNIKLFDEN